MKMIFRPIFLALGIAGVAMATVASHERSVEAASATAAAVVRSASLFGGLKACEVPGLHERLLANGDKTLVYAGEFTRTRTTSWTTGKARIFLYVVSGSGLVQIGNMSMRAGPGDFFVIPKGARHAVSAESDKLRAVYFEDRT